MIAVLKSRINLRKNAAGFITGLLNSYSQVFFSDNKAFALVILLVSFADVYAGLAGLLAVMVTNITGHLIGLDKRNIGKGIYGFNSLLVGLSLGIYYSPGPVLYILILLASVLTLFVSVNLHGIIGKYGLPFLSLPFVFSAWIMTISAKNMSFLALSERGIFTMNELYTIGGKDLVQVYNWWNTIEFLKPVKTYFISLGAILFQYNVLSGIIISLGLLYFSRIAFTLSLIGFVSAYFFYSFIGADISDINYSYIGFNYILTSVAVGGFFIIPSVRSFLWSLILIPIVALISISTYFLFLTASLPVYALPFNIVVLLFLYTLKLRTEKKEKLHEVIIQQNSPEKNLYSFENDTKRVRYDLVPMRLPFYGPWHVTQDYDGGETHIGSFKYALDFVILNNEGKQYNNKGDIAEDYLCFNKPVLAPADGIVDYVVDNIEDNIIGKPNILDNWGNTVIIRHNDFVYSTLSHLKKGTVAVKKGERVKQGSLIAKCGNSGRSPYPHLHFQVQSLPFIGSGTIEYPLSYYIKNELSGFSLVNYEAPALRETVSNIQVIDLLKNAFEFIPGRTIRFETALNGKQQVTEWQVFTSEFNLPYIRCMESGAVAYFYNDGNVFFFRHFEGKRSTFLFYFFLAHYKVPLGYYSNFSVADTYPVDLITPKGILFLQDFLAPFHKFIRPVFSLNYSYIDNEVLPTIIKINSSSVTTIGRRAYSRLEFETQITDQGLTTFKATGSGLKLIAKSC
jgi:urea transporter